MIPCVNVLRKDNFVIFAVVLVILRKCASNTALVKKFLTRRREAGIRLQRNKFILAQPEVTFAGIILFNHKGYRMQDKVIKPIRDFKKPESLTDLQSF